MKHSQSFYPLLSGTSMLLVAYSTPAAAQTWKPADAPADWAGADYNNSDGMTPKPEYCGSENVGMVAVCWNVGGSGGKGWCTYKNRNTSTKADGAHPGQVYWCSGDVKPKDILVVSHWFEAREAGSFLIKTTKEMDTPEFQVLLTSACAALLVDCSEEAVGISQGAYYVNDLISTSSLQPSAVFDRCWSGGENYYAKFVAPDGYTTCKAKIDTGNGSITGESTFNGAIQRMPGKWAMAVCSGPKEQAVGSMGGISRLRRICQDG